MADRDRPLVIGVGQPWRGDDAAGLAALELLGGPWDCVAHSGEGLGLIALWEGRDRVVVIDSARSGAPAGTLHRLEASATPLAAEGFRCSSHAFGVREGVETARVLGRLPRRLVLHAVEGEAWGLGAPLSPRVRAALPALVEAVRRDIGPPPPAAPSPKV